MQKIIDSIGELQTTFSHGTQLKIVFNKENKIRIMEKL